MDELAAPAAVVTMSIDENDDSDLELEVARSVSVASDVMIAAPDATGVGKENQGDLPVDRQLGAANPKVILRKLTSHNPPCSQPNLCAIAPFVPQAEVSALLLRAEILFPEGKSEPRAAAKVGASAKLTTTFYLLGIQAHFWSTRSVGSGTPRGEAPFDMVPVGKIYI